MGANNVELEEQLWQQLQGRWPENIIEPSLTRIASVMSLLGDPQLSYPVIQIAGTNGKSSTARMVESILRSFGLRTGLFTSPHLMSPRERICFDGQPITSDRVVSIWQEIEPFIRLVDKNSVEDGGPQLSYFETLTALAYAAFADAPVDVAIIEVGLGGTWDATSVCHPTVAVITPIGMDHQEYLGDTIELIAAEKAGILVSASAAVIGPQVPEAAAIITQATTEAGLIPARFAVEYGIDSQVLAVGGQQLTLRGLRGVYDNIFLPLWGEHQGVNAAIALAACESFLGSAHAEALDVEVVREGFAGVRSPGRLEVVRASPTTLVDVAHNPHGAAALAQALAGSFDFRSIVGVIGMLSDKDAVGFVETLAPLLTHLVVTEPLSPRALPVDDLMAIAQDVMGRNKVSQAPHVVAAVERAVELSDDSGQYGGAGIIVTGSVVLVGELLAALTPSETPPKG